MTGLPHSEAGRMVPRDELLGQDERVHPGGQRVVPGPKEIENFQVALDKTKPLEDLLKELQT